MRKILAFSLLAFAAVGVTGCKGMPAAVSSAASVTRERPLDNFGEILSPKKPKAEMQSSTHGQRPADNFGEIL